LRIKTEESIIIKTLREDFPDLLENLLNVHGGWIVNMIGMAHSKPGKWKTIKSIFQREKKKDGKIIRKSFRIPDPKNPGKMKTVHVID